MHTLHLRDRSGDLVMAWQQAFSGLAQVQASQGDIFDHPADAVVSPANSFGYMDGGIDLVYAHFFGWEIEAALRNRIQDEHHGELPVGQAIVLPTGHASVPFMVFMGTARKAGRPGRCWPITGTCCRSRALRRATAVPAASRAPARSGRPRGGGTRWVSCP